MSSSDLYYVALDDQVFGPYSLDEVSDLGLLPDTLVSRSDSEWTNASEMPELRHLFHSDNQYNTQRQSPLFNNKQLIYKQKRKAALIGVLTLGLAGLAIIGVGETWRSNIFAGTSFDQGGLGFVMKIISFMIVSVIVAIPFFIISLIQLIYYSIKLSSTN
ncbi:MAG: DUF4339 domain-containing protein [Alloprevotella sp.]|nr:DUF4339 domain-containing protein [Alloprevotella sp.]